MKSSGSFRWPVKVTTSLRRTWFLLALVGAIVIGLLGMHIVQTGLGNHNDPFSAMGSELVAGDMASLDSAAASEQTPRTIAAMAAGSECSGMCDPGHMMSRMICILALLFTGVLLAAVRPAPAAPFLVPATLTREHRHAGAAVPGPAPPNLDALSISRT